MHFYFVIRSGEDGTTISGPYSAEVLEKELFEGHWGEGGHTFLDKVPESDKGCWWQTPDNAMLIIKGEIVRPDKVEVVQKYRLP
jgi:hypothetical protein